MMAYMWLLHKKMAKVAAFSAVFLALALVPASSSLPTCPVLTAQPSGVTCSPSDSCEGVTCFIDTSIAGNSSITVQRCGDPVLVDMRAQGVYNDTSFDFMYQFNDSATVTQEGTTVTATLERNQTDFVFSAQLESYWLVPEVTVPINSTECLCNSLEELAMNIHSPLEHNCVTNENCTGVTCELDVFGSVYYIDMLVLSCEDPPAIDVLVEDSEGNPFYEAFFNQSGSSPLMISGISVTLNRILVHNQYSMEVEASLVNVPIFGYIPIVPRHTILLDPSTCPQPPTVTTTASPPPPSTIAPPPTNSSNLCNTLYQIAMTTSPPFACYLSEACTALECELDSANVRYDVIIKFFSQQAQTKAYISVSTPQGLLGRQAVQESGTWHYDVAPENSKLIFTFVVMEAEVQFKLELDVSYRVETLIPLWNISLTSSGLPTCPVLTAQPSGVTCFPSDSCEGVTCFIDTSIAGNSSITVQRCGDPVLVDMRAQGVYNDTSFDFMYQFNDSATVTQEGTTVTATLERSQTDFVFSAQLESYWLVPEVTVAINSTECLCNSLEELAMKIHSPLEHNCVTNENCTGVTCELDVFGSVYYIDILVLSCEDPPAIDVLVEDSEGNPFYEALFNQSGSSPLAISGISVTLNRIVVHNQYSMEIEASIVNVPIFGYIPVIPRHTILLDPSTCPQPPTITTTASPPSPSTITPPPTNSSNLCNTLYQIAVTTHPPFACYLSEACTALECELDSANVRYDVIIRFFSQEAQTKAYISVSTSQGLLGHQAVQESGTWNYDVAPENSKLIFTFVVMEAEVQFKLELDVSYQVETLILLRNIPLEILGECPSLVPIIQQYPQCIYLEDCTGLQCIPDFGYVHSATAVVGKCQDPVTVDLTLERNGQTVFQQVFDASKTVDDGLDVRVEMSRNDTHLELSVATLIEGDIVIPVIPMVSIPLDPTACSCQSLEELAEKTHSPLEHDCATNENCDGVRCELDVFGAVYHLETILLSCEKPPAVDVVVENEQDEPLYASQFNRTGSYDLVISGLELGLYAVVEHHEYSMDVAGYLSVPIFGNITIIPPHTILLDRTSCPLPPSPPTPPTSPPTFAPGPSASETCQSLFAIANSEIVESFPFMCEVLADGNDCDTLKCRLGLQDGLYTIAIQLYPQGSDAVASVSVANTSGSSLASVDVKDTRNFRVYISDDEVLAFAFSSEGESLKMKVSIAVAGAEPTTLIDSEVPLQESSSESHSDQMKALKVSIPLVAVAVCVVALVVAIVVLVVWWRRHPSRQFEFKPMTYGDLKANEEDMEESEKAAENGDHMPQAVENEYEPVNAAPLSSAHQTDM